MIDESRNVDYGEPTTQMSRTDMKIEIARKVPTDNVRIDYPYSDEVNCDVAIMENNEPVLNILLMNWKWDKNRSKFHSPDDYTSIDRIERHQNCQIPLYSCLTSKRIQQTADFVHLWINREYTEMYKLYPNKIAEINKRRKQ
jgi:hypothetical protein